MAEYTSFVRLPVQWNDLDAFGHVNNVHYIRWFESSRVSYLTDCGLAELLTGKSLGPILAAVTCNYRRPLFFPDSMQVGARVSRLGRTSMTIEHAIFSDQQQQLVAEGDSRVVLFDYERQRPHVIPDEMRHVINTQELQRRPFETTS